MIHDTNKLNKKNNMIISIDTEKAFNKTECQFMIILHKMGVECSDVNITKTIYDKPTAKIIFNAGKLKTFPLKSGTRQRFPLLPLLFFLFYFIF